MDLGGLKAPIRGGGRMIVVLRFRNGVLKNRELWDLSKNLNEKNQVRFDSWMINYLYEERIRNKNWIIPKST